jgi:hypothetical protein
MSKIIRFILLVLAIVGIVLISIGAVPYRQELVIPGLALLFFFGLVFLGSFGLGRPTYRHRGSSASSSSTSASRSIRSILGL